MQSTIEDFNYRNRICCGKRMKKSQRFIDCEGVKISYVCGSCGKQIVKKV